MRQLVLVVDSQCFVASIYALDVRMAKPLLNGRFFTIVGGANRKVAREVAREPRPTSLRASQFVGWQRW